MKIFLDFECIYTLGGILFLTKIEQKCYGGDRCCQFKFMVDW